MKTARYCFLSLLIASVCLGTVGQSTAMGQDFEASIDWINYSDASGRVIDYDFSSGTIVGSRMLAIPADAVTLPASETGTTYRWVVGDGVSNVWLSSNRFYFSIPQALPAVIDIPTADITLDGAIGDWAGVSTYIDDFAGDTDVSYPTGCDLDYLKLAYSSDNTTLYILFVLTEGANQDVWYRLFLDKDLDGEVDEPGDYQIDVQHTGSGWDVVSQSWDASRNWYDVPENGLVAVSGQYVEAAVDCSAFGLPGNTDVYGRTMQDTDPYETYDRFTSNFHETWGYLCMTADATAAPTPTQWQCSARFRDFSFPGFGDSTPYVNFVGVDLSGGESNSFSPAMSAFWVTGDFMGNELDDALVIMASVESWDDVNDMEYEWEWGPETSGGVTLAGLDPSTTTVDLNIQVTDAGQTASFYYRINSDSAGDWQLGVSHTLPAGTGTIYGFPVNGLAVMPECGFMRSAPVYRFWSPDNARHFYTTSRVEKNSIIATYPPSVWTYEQIAYYAFAEDSDPNVGPVYRFWSPLYAGHFYTISENEKDSIIATYPPSVWTYEGAAFYAYPAGLQPAETRPVYRFWSPLTGGHFYTISEAEKNNVIATYPESTWTYEGVAWYAYEQMQDN